MQIISSTYFITKLPQNSKLAILEIAVDEYNGSCCQNSQSNFLVNSSTCKLVNSYISPPPKFVRRAFSST